MGTKYLDIETWLLFAPLSKFLVTRLQGSRLFFSGSRECAYSNTHAVSCEKRIYYMNTRVYFC